jgi:hypothetical protein
MERVTSSQMDIDTLLVGRKSKGREFLLYLAYSQLSSAQNNLYAKAAYLRWHVLLSFNGQANSSPL